MVQEKATGFSAKTVFFCDPNQGLCLTNLKLLRSKFGPHCVVRISPWV